MAHHKAIQEERSELYEMVVCLQLQPHFAQNHPGVSSQESASLGLAAGLLQCGGQSLPAFASPLLPALLLAFATGASAAPVECSSPVKRDENKEWSREEIIALSIGLITLAVMITIALWELVRGRAIARSRAGWKSLWRTSPPKNKDRHPRWWQLKP